MSWSNKDPRSIISERIKIILYDGDRYESMMITIDRNTKYSISIHRRSECKTDEFSWPKNWWWSYCPEFK